MPKGDPLKAVSIFSGAGGFDLGIEAAGFETRLCTDIDYHSCRTLKQNRRAGRVTGRHSFLQSCVVLQRDIKKLSIDTILRAARLQVGETDLLVGGPPCQSFSVFGRRKGIEDPRGSLLWEFIRVVRGLRPKAFIFENVYGLLSIDDGAVFQRFMEELAKDENGNELYSLSNYLLDTSYFGVPQYRTRLIVFGTLGGPRVSKPAYTHCPPGHSGRPARVVPGITTDQLEFDFQDIASLPPTPTVADALRGLPSPPDTKYPNHVGRDHSERIIKRYASLRYGERDHKTRINKLHPEQPSFTIIVGSDKGGGKGHVHPFEPREVTPRESARIQTFPDHWAFSGTSKHPIRQIGNAVPPLFAGQLASHVMREYFGRHDAPTHDELVGLLGLDYLVPEREESERAEAVSLGV